MSRTHPTYLAIVILFAVILQLVLMWRLRRALPTEAKRKHPLDRQPEE